MLRICMPLWRADKLRQMYCTRCAWARAVPVSEARNPSREFARQVGDAFEAHRCADFPRAASVLKVK